MGPIRCPEISMKNYHSTLRNVPEECRSQLCTCVGPEVSKCTEIKSIVVFQPPTTFIMVTLLQDSMPRSLVIRLNNFRGNCCLHFDDTLKEDVPEGGGSRLF
jgi:hypothetical protein